MYIKSKTEQIGLSHKSQIVFLSRGYKIQQTIFQRFFIKIGHQKK